MANPNPIGRSSSTIRPAGPRLMMSNVHLLADEGKAQIAAGATSLTIDMAEIDFVDSSGIGALIGLRKRIPDGQVTLINVGGFVATVLKKTKTASLFVLA